MSSCDCGYSYEDIDHVMWQCEKYVIVDRKKLKLEMVKRKIRNRKIEFISRILQQEDWTEIRVISNFIRKIGRIVTATRKTDLTTLYDIPGVPVGENLKKRYVYKVS